MAPYEYTAGGNRVGTFQDRRIRMKERLRNPPFSFPPGLAHVVASVAEPRSDESDRNDRVDAIVTEHREQLLNELKGVLSDNPTEKVSMRSFGGRVEHTVEGAAQRLRQAAEEHGAYEIVLRLDRLQQERRLGASDDQGRSGATSKLEIDTEALPRSTTSGRRIGLWR